MERTLENVHVVIYCKKMLKEAIKRLNNSGQNIETDIMCDFKFHGNDLLIYHDGLFKVVQCLPTHPNQEVTLNDLCEMIIDKEDSKFKLGDWIFAELEGNENAGFSVMLLTMKSSVEYYNRANCPHSAIKISHDTFKRLRKDATCGKQ